MFLICGLGNPGKKYIKTRHNIGFQLVDKLSNFYNFSSLKKDNKKEVLKGSINNNACLLMKPLSFMNLSGQPIQEIINFYKIEKNKLFIIHDDLDLGLGKVKIKYGGSNGGHNGLLSIDEMIGTNYYRLRIGIDHPGDKDKVTKHVLGNFNEVERKSLFALFEVIYLNFSQIFISKHLSNLGI